MADSKTLLLALTRIQGIGAISARKLIMACGGLNKLFLSTYKELVFGYAVPTRIATLFAEGRDSALQEATHALANAKQINARLVTFEDEDYPQRLLSCDDAPIAFFVKGNCNLDSKYSIAIVGSRRATKYGLDFTKTLVQQFAQTGISPIIISGLAYGVDIEAHRAAVESNLPTVAVLGSGLNNIYPKSHISTANKIVDNGSLISEFFPDDSPDAPNFIRRNRIIAGLADCVVVVETGLKGGALTTADIAFSYNRDIFALPGNINGRMSVGCNALIKYNKASLVESADDIFRVMNWDVKSVGKQLSMPVFVDMTAEEKTVFDIIEKKSTVHFDDLESILSIKSNQLSLVLLQLEFKGIIRTLPGKYYSV